MTELFPEEEVDGVVSSALDQPGVRLEVALPFGFDKDPKATSERIAATTEEIQRLPVPAAPTAGDIPIGGPER